MFDAAMLVSDAMRDIDRRDGQHLAANAASFPSWIGETIEQSFGDCGNA